jgi:hypothetical protein
MIHGEGMFSFCSVVQIAYYERVLSSVESMGEPAEPEVTCYRSSPEMHRRE